MGLKPRAGSSPAFGTIAQHNSWAFHIMFTVYVLKSNLKKFHYVGFTDNLERRLAQHNAGYNKSTKPYRPFELLYTETVNTSHEARKREKFLKSGKGREFINNLEDESRAGGSP